MYYNLWCFTSFLAVPCTLCFVLFFCVFSLMKTSNFRGWSSTPYGKLRRIKTKTKGYSIKTGPKFDMKKGKLLSDGYGPLTILPYDTYSKSEWFNYGVVYRRRPTITVAVPSCTKAQAPSTNIFCPFINRPDKNQGANCWIKVWHEGTGRISFYSTCHIGMCDDLFYHIPGPNTELLAKYGSCMTKSVSEHNLIRLLKKRSSISSLQNILNSWTEDD